MAGNRRIKEGRLNPFKRSFERSDNLYLGGFLMMKKRLLSALLAFVMVLGMIPTSVFAVENVPFTVTVDGAEITEITEDVIQWPDWSGMTTDLPLYTVAVFFKRMT